MAATTDATDMSPAVSASSPLLPNGVYVPTIAFFDEADEVDVKTTMTHAIFLAESGVSGLVVHGSNGECAHLSREERNRITSTVRSALDASDFVRMPLVAGCGAQSTKETVELCCDAAANGAGFALVLPPSYYGGLLTTDHVVRHFHAVAEASPIPVLVYNFPGAAAGLDLSSDAVLKIAAHSNVAGVKLTCGNTGKLARLAADAPPTFFVAGGSADFILQGMVVGAHGTISGLANLCPRACMRIMELASQGKMLEARRVQAVVARADWVAIRTGFVGVKAALNAYYGYGGLPRKPCEFPSDAELTSIRDGFSEVMALERSLCEQAGRALETAEVAA